MAPSPFFARASPVFAPCSSATFVLSQTQELACPLLVHSGLASGAMLLCKLLDIPVTLGLGVLPHSKVRVHAEVCELFLKLSELLQDLMTRTVRVN